MGRPKAPVKPQQFSVRLHADDMQILKDLSTLHGTSLSGAVVEAVRAAWGSVPATQRKAIEAIKQARPRSKK